VVQNSVVQQSPDATRAAPGPHRPIDDGPPPHTGLRLGLRGRLALFVVALVGLSWLGYALVLAPQFRRSFRAVQEQKIELHAHIVSVEIDRAMSAALRELEAIAALPSIRRLAPGELEAELARLDAVHQSYLHFTVLDPHGIVLARPSKPERVGADRSHMPYYTKARDTRRTGIADIRVSTAGNLSLSAYTPLVGDGGELRGVLTGSIGLMDRNRELYRLVTEPATTEWPAEVYLIDDAGRVIADSTRGSRELASVMPVAASSEGTTVMADRGEPWIVASDPIPSARWRVVVRVPERVVDAQVEAIALRATYLALGLLVLVALLGIVAADRFARPLERLTHAIADYGRGRATIELDVTGTGEVREAIAAFRTMRVERERATAERERIAGQMLHAQKLQTVGTLAGGIAHDFNNLLTPILLGAERLARTSTLAPDERRIANAIQTSAERARELVARILAFSRSSEVHRVPIDIATVVDDALRLVEVSLPPLVRLRTTLDREAGAVLADATQLHQVILNVCKNAIDAMSPAGGWLDVALAKLDDGQVELSVRDTGTGIPPDVLDRVFEPFFTTKPVGKGTGLGLAMAHGIIGQHDGTIAIESAVDRGTLVRITLPTVLANAAEAPGRATLDAPVGTGRILVVDDDDAVAAAEQGLLAELGYEAVAETTTSAAVARITAGEHFDLVVSDHNMPDRSGHDLVRAIHSVRPHQRFLVVTGVVDPALRASYAALGVTDVAAKPLTIDELARAVRDALHGPSGAPRT